jgi:hypothetical protein
MATTIQSITAVWVRWSPDPLSGFVQEDVLGEQFIRWGVPVTGQLSSMGFLGSFPPVGSVDIGDTFAIGRIRILNRPVTGNVLSSVTLQLTFEFGGPGGITQKLDLPFTYIPSASPGEAAVLTLAATLPAVATAGDLQLLLYGIDQSGEVSPSLLAQDGLDAEGQIMARLEQSPLEHSACTEGFEPVFTPAGCEVAEVCALPDGQIIFDCGIPEPPDPITDCGEIDVSAPTLASAAESILSSIIGSGGGGLISLLGCRVEIRAKYKWNWVKNCAFAGVYVRITPCNPPPPPDPDGRTVCCYLLDFRFYFCWYPVYFYYACCPAIWCDGDWMPADDYWCDGVTMPDPVEVPGRFPGELIHICSCTSTTTTTTTSTTTTSTTTTPPPGGPTTTTTTTTSTTTLPPCTDKALLICIAAGSTSLSYTLKLNGTTLTSALDFAATECKTYLFLTDLGIDHEVMAAKIMAAAAYGMSCCQENVVEVDGADLETYTNDDGSSNFLVLDENASGSTTTTPNPSSVGIGFVAFVDLVQVVGEWEICHIRLNELFDTDEDPLSFAFTN